MEQLLLVILFALPFVLTLLNIVALIQYLVAKKEARCVKGIEAAAICTGTAYLLLYAGLTDIVFANWDVPLYAFQLHSMVWPDASLTVAVLSLIALAGYGVVRFIPARKQPPIVSVLGISAIYLGMGICVVWCVQTISDFFLVLFPANCIIIFIKTIYILVHEKSILLRDKPAPSKCKRLSSFLSSAARLPWAALLLAIPLLGVVVVILLLFGQEPSSIIKAWTETADWTLSQKIAPQSIPYDGHYLCTVAAGGHRSVVKPLRTGIRHGHRVVVNRQLCIANAFEQVLEEKAPVLHKAVRTVYDRTGYPLSKHIHSKYLADAIYLLMKPLEWLFLLVLYAVDAEPENRIAVQYPHAPIPDVLT